MSRRPCWVMDTSLDSMSGGVSAGCALQVTLIMAQRQTQQPLRDGKLHITNKINDRLPQKWNLVNHLMSRTLTQITWMSASLGSHVDGLVYKKYITPYVYNILRDSLSVNVEVVWRSCIGLKVCIATVHVNIHFLSSHISIFCRILSTAWLWMLMWPIDHQH